MHNSTLYARTALEDWVQTNDSAAMKASIDLNVALRNDLGLATLMTRRGRRAALLAALGTHFGVEAPLGPCVVQGPTVSLVGCGPDHWLAYSEHLKNQALCEQLQSKLAGLAAVCDQSDSRVVVRLSGPKTREVLTKGIAVDLHPRVFGPDGAAATLIEHMGVQLWQIDAKPTYDLAVSRSLAGSWWRWLVESAAAAGCKILLSAAGSGIRFVDTHPTAHASLVQ